MSKFNTFNDNEKILRDYEEKLRQEIRLKLFKLSRESSLKKISELYEIKYHHLSRIYNEQKSVGFDLLIIIAVTIGIEIKLPF